MRLSCILLIAIFTFTAYADDDNLNLGLSDLKLCMSSVSAPSVPLLLVNSTENPHSRAIGERIAGWVLLGTSLFNFIIAVPYAEVMEDSYMSADLIKALFFIEGGIRAVIGGVFLTSGYIKYGRWKGWEAEHSGKISFPHHIALNFEF